MSESLGPDTQDRIPREAIEAARAVAREWTACDPDAFVPLDAARQMVEAAYPLIRERVCQELAEALKGDEAMSLTLKAIHDLAAAQPGNPAENWNEADGHVLAETLADAFVERFGKAER